MLRDKFTEELDVELTKEEQDIRGRQSARLALALTKHDEKVEQEAEEWRTRKKTHAGEREIMVGTLHRTATAAETGVERREVPCKDELVGVMVVTTRLDCDPPETVSTRPATKQELGEHDKPRAKPAPTTPQDREGVIRGHIAELCAKLRPESLLLKALAKACPNATPDELKAAVSREVELGTLTEDATGKLMWIAPPPGPTHDDGVVDDDYRPDAHAH
jgi:hypothetical protein